MNKKLLVSTLAVGCGVALLTAAPALAQVAKNTNESTSNPTMNASADNTLTAAEKEAGWQLLFDGKTTSGWHNYLKKDVSPVWKVENGVLVMSGKGAGDLISNDQYENFELELEWKISEGGNSGIFYHVVEDAKYNTPYMTGPEIQILDNEKHPDAKQGKNGNRTAGSLYDMLPPMNKTVTKPVGEFNKMRVVMKNGKAEHYMNGTKIVEYPTKGPQWDSMVKDSKFATWEGFGKFSEGHIGLQDHGDVVMFKNIKVRPL